MAAAAAGLAPRVGGRGLLSGPLSKPQWRDILRAVAALPCAPHLMAASLRHRRRRPGPQACVITAKTSIQRCSPLSRWRRGAKPKHLQHKCTSSTPEPAPCRLPIRSVELEHAARGPVVQRRCSRPRHESANQSEVRVAGTFCSGQFQTLLEYEPSSF